MRNSPSLSDCRRRDLRVFLAFVTVLLAIGTLMIYSSGMSSMGLSESNHSLRKHLGFASIAICFAIVSAQIPPEWWLRFVPFLYTVTVLLLIAVMIPGLGLRVNGAQRWLRLGPISLQPSETAKLTVPLLICSIRCRSNLNVQPNQLGQLFKIGLLLSIPIGLILIEPDLGTALFVTIGAGLCFFLTRLPLKYFVIVGSLAIPTVIGLVVAKPYQLARVQGFIQTWTNPESAPYQIRQSLTTLGVGGIQGTGLGRGWQKLSFLPESNTDFIFSVIGEELGLMGTLGVAALWLGVYLSGLRLIQHTQNRFQSVLASVLLIQLVMQAALNIAVVTAMVPPKGISHPLISYGGSNLVTSLVSIGMIVSLSKEPRKKDLSTSDLEVETETCVPELFPTLST